MSDYPEHDKLNAISDKSQAIGEFIDALNDRGIVLAYANRWGEYHPVMKPISELLAEHFGIDRAVIEQEKRAMLAAMRAMNERGWA